MIFLSISVSLLKLSKNIKQNSAHIYRKCLKEGLTARKSTHYFIIAILYIVCKTYKNPISLEEFETTLSLDKNKIGKYVRFIQHELKIPMSVSTPIDYLYSIGSKSGSSESCHRNVTSNELTVVLSLGLYSLNGMGGKFIGESFLLTSAE